MGRRGPDLPGRQRGRVMSRRSDPVTTTEPRNSRHSVTHAPLGHIWRQCKWDFPILRAPVSTSRELSQPLCCLASAPSLCPPAHDARREYLRRARFREERETAMRREAAQTLRRRRRRTSVRESHPKSEEARPIGRASRDGTRLIRLRLLLLLSTAHLHFGDLLALHGDVHLHFAR
jgi:hypothetical protein